MSAKTADAATGTDSLLAALEKRAVNQLSEKERQDALVAKLRERAIMAPLVEGGSEGRQVAQWVAQNGHHERAHDFLQQLNRIAEAQHVLDMAWSADYFADCMVWAADVMNRNGERTKLLDLRFIQDSVANVKRRAYELLAEQYPDVRVRVDPQGRWSVGERNWCKVLGGPEDVK